jgi:hypothetical protein
MPYLILIVISLVLFLGFISMTIVETRRGVRMFLPLRESFDKTASRILFVLTHVDLASFVSKLLRDLGSRIAHDGAHGSLLAVRFFERLLTRAVRTLRLRNSTTTPVAPKETSHFVRTIMYFKQTLRHSRKTAVPPSTPPEDAVG